MAQQSNRSAQDRLARMHQAVDQVLQNLGLTDAVARQSAPNNAKARQTTPSAPIWKNEPTCHNDTGSSPSPSTSREGRAERRHGNPITAIPQTPPNPRQSAPNHAKAPHPTPSCKTNPPPSSIIHPPSSSSKRLRPLTPNQLRAARLLVAGQSTVAVAATLAIDRHTLATWKKKPLFQLELRRLLDSPFDTVEPRS